MPEGKIRVHLSTISAEEATCYAVDIDGSRWLGVGDWGGGFAVLPAGAALDMELTSAELDGALDVIRAGNTNFAIRRLS